MSQMTAHDLAYWLADKIPAYGDYAKQSADVLKRQADKIERNREAIAELVAALKGGIVLASNAHVYWDSDQDAKVGKHLMALSGALKGYDTKADAIHAAITKHDTQPTKKGSN